jgi:hypothetical protein
MKFAAHDSLQQFSQIIPQVLSVLPPTVPSQEQITFEQQEDAQAQDLAPQSSEAERAPLNPYTPLDVQDHIDSTKTSTLSVSGRDTITGNETVLPAY